MTRTMCFSNYWSMRLIKNYMYSSVTACAQYCLSSSRKTNPVIVITARVGVGCWLNFTKLHSFVISRSASVSVWALPSFLDFREKSFSDVRHRCRLVQRLRRCWRRWQRRRVTAARAVAERAAEERRRAVSVRPFARSPVAQHSIRARVQCQHKMLTTQPVDLVCVSIWQWSKWIPADCTRRWSTPSGSSARRPCMS